MTKLIEINFHGSTLLAIAGDSAATTMIAMKPLFEGAGVEWRSQRRRIMRHPVLAQGVVVMTTPSDGGPQEALFLPLDKVDFALATLHPDRVKDAKARANLILYQTEAAQVLYAHFQPQRSGHKVTLLKMGGMVKGITKKALAEFAAQMAETNAASEKRMAAAIAAAEMRMENIALGHDPSIGRRKSQMTMLEIVEGNNVTMKKDRAKLTRALSAGMVSWCRANGVLTGQTSERKTILYPVECIPRWLNEIGGAKIRAHIARVTGQGVFDYEAEKKKRGR